MDKNEKYIDLEFAKLDIDRFKRRGASEAVFCECKTNEQLETIFTAFKNNNSNIIGTRACIEQIKILKNKINNL